MAGKLTGWHYLARAAAPPHQARAGFTPSGHHKALTNSSTIALHAVYSFVHVADAAEGTVAAIEHGSRGVYNVVDDDPAPVAEWLPALAQTLGAKKPMRVPRFVGRLFAGEAGVVMMTEIRGASNAKAKRELQWRPAHPSWRQGFAMTPLPATVTGEVPA
jgi:nucleoside-diphosphate-sugar epimerase